MASESVTTALGHNPLAVMAVSEQLNRHAYMLDGVSAILDGLVESTSDRTVARQMPILVETLDRLNSEISQLAADLARASGSIRESQPHELAGTF